MKVSDHTYNGFLVKSLWGEYPLRSPMESKNLLIIKTKKRSWIEHIFWDMPCTKWIIHKTSCNVHSDIETEVLLLLLYYRQRTPDIEEISL